MSWFEVEIIGCSVVAHCMVDKEDILFLHGHGGRCNTVGLGGGGTSFLKFGVALRMLLRFDSIFCSSGMLCCMEPNKMDAKQHQHGCP